MNEGKTYKVLSPSLRDLSGCWDRQNQLSLGKCNYWWFAYDSVAKPKWIHGHIDPSVRHLLKSLGYKKSI